MYTLASSVFLSPYLSSSGIENTQNGPNVPGDCPISLESGQGVETVVSLASESWKHALLNTPSASPETGPPGVVHGTLGDPEAHTRRPQPHRLIPPPQGLEDSENRVTRYHLPVFIVIMVF